MGFFRDRLMALLDTDEAKLDLVAHKLRFRFPNRSGERPTVECQDPDCDACNHKEVAH